MRPAGTVGEAIKRLSDSLNAVGVDDSMREARLIVSSVFNIPMSRLTLCLQDNLSQADLQVLDDTALGRLERRPLSHVLGHRAFFKHDFRVGPDVLDPRPDTESLVICALAKSFHSVLDLGVGSGAILLSLLAERPGVRGVGTDISPDALRYAQSNADRLGVSARCDFVQSDWYENLAGSFDLIVSNPPYIAANEMEGLAPELSFEPRIALTDEADGLSAYRVLVAGAGEYLNANGHLIVEIGPTQGEAVVDMFVRAGFEGIQLLPDLDGRDRVVEGVRRGV